MSKLPWNVDTAAYLADTDGLTPATRGIWSSMLARMSAAPERGKLVGTKDDLCQYGACQRPAITAFLKENRTKKFADISTNHGIIIIINRRMHREYVAREDARQRQARKKIRDHSPRNHDDFTELWERWPNKEGADEAELRLFAHIPSGGIEDFRAAANHYLKATNGRKPEFVKTLANFIGRAGNEPWREWIDGNPNKRKRKPFCTLANTGEKILTQATAKRMEAAGEIANVNGTWTRLKSAEEAYFGKEDAT